MAKVEKVKEEKEEKLDLIESILADKEFKGMHLGSRSGTEVIERDIISTGSKMLDEALGGGYRSASWARVWSDDPEAGKTSMGLVWARNWQKYYEAKGERGLVIYFNAEGRINDELLARSGIDTDKNVFRIIDTNKADFIYDFIERHVDEVDKKTHVFYLLDSTDALQRSIDEGKKFADADKIAGGASIQSAAGKRLSILFGLKSHFLYICSQARDKMTTGPGGGGRSASGGNAIKFYSSLTIKVLRHWSDFAILEDPSNKKSKEIGKLAQLKLEKTYNESTGQTVLVPILKGRVGGVWEEYEAILMCQAWDLLKDEGKGRYAFAESFAQDLKDNNIQFEEKFHGMKSVRNHFNENKPLVDYIFKKMESLRL